MTREEAIMWLIQPTITSTEISVSKAKELEAYDMAIEALKDQEQPHICPQCGKVFGECMNLVRCKDCKHFIHYADGCGVCTERDNILTYQNQNDFCSYGERKGGGDE